MIKAQSIGKTIVASINNKLYNKEFDTVEERLEVYEFLSNATKYDDIQKAIELFTPKETETDKQAKIEFEKKKEESKKVEDILDFMKEVKTNEHDIFEVVENSLYVKGIKITMPELLIREIIKAEDNPERLNALLNFWKLCALNPDPRARFDLFKFLHNHNLTLTPSGNFVAYRTVDKHKTGNEELEKFVTQEWMKVKRWKKSPKNYIVGNNNGEYNVYLIGQIVEGSLVGNLDELYHNIGEVSGNVYTDAYTGTCRIKIGEPVKMDRGQVDPDPNNACSVGYHAGNQAFMKSNMGFFGKVGIVVLINPKNVTSVPSYDSGKLRTCEYLPIAIAELDENGYIKDVDIDVFDLEMAQNTQEELEAMSLLDSTELEEYKKHEFIAPEVDFKMVNNILNSVTISIEDANNKIKDRVVKV